MWPTGPTGWSTRRAWQQQDPRPGGPPLRHPAREADGPVRGPADQRADAGPQGPRGDAGRRGAPTGSVTVGGPLRRAGSVGRGLRAGAGRHGPGGEGAARRRPARGDARDRAAPGPAVRRAATRRSRLGPEGGVLWDWRPGRRDRAAASRSSRGCGCWASSGHDAARQRAARRLEAFVAAEAGPQAGGAAQAGGRGGRRQGAGPGPRPGLPADRGRRGRWTGPGAKADTRRAEPGRAPHAAQPGRPDRRLLALRAQRCCGPRPGRWPRPWSSARPAAGRPAAGRRPPARPAALGAGARRLRPARGAEPGRAGGAAGAAGRAAAGRADRRTAACCSPRRPARRWAGAPTTATIILRALGFAPVNRPQAGEPIAWRRRAERKAEPAAPPRPHSPFAALAALQGQARPRAPAAPPEEGRQEQ